LTAVFCSSIVSATVVLLRPVQLNNQLLEQSRNILALTGLIPAGEVPEEDELLHLFKGLDRRIVNIDDGVFAPEMDVDSFNQRRAVNDPDTGIRIPPELDRANMGRRSRFAPVYIVWENGELERIILPVRGSGMWSMIYGYIALESDFKQIAGMSFYEQNETPGLGDQIIHAHWLEQWAGRRVYDEQGNLRFSVAPGLVQPGSSLADYQVDALTGATVTGNAVTGLIHYWFGPHGYQDFLIQLREHPPEQPQGGAA
jgi:Na+-transporting NADH:ubiquinone oxidoreductase subunit C